MFKNYPSQIHTQGPIALAAELSKRVAVSEIESIHIDAYKVAASTASTEPEKWAPKTKETADHSIPFVVAAALRDGQVTPNTFADQAIADAELRTIMGKIDLVENEEFTAKYPQEYNSRITITDRFGVIHTAHAPFFKGHHNNPLDDTDVEAKFCNFSSSILTARQCDNTLKTIWTLEDLPDLEELFDGLVV